MFVNNLLMYSCFAREIIHLMHADYLKVFRVF